MSILDNINELHSGSLDFIPFQGKLSYAAPCSVIGDHVWLMTGKAHIHFSLNRFVNTNQHICINNSAKLKGIGYRQIWPYYTGEIELSAVQGRHSGFFELVGRSP